MEAAAPRKSTCRVMPSARAVVQRHAPAATANTRLATEIVFGATPARVSIRANPWAHARCLVLSGRRGGVALGSIEDALLITVLVEVKNCATKCHKGQSKIAGGIANATGDELKRNFALSLLFGVGGALGAYTLAWGLFTTHPEIGMTLTGARDVALWTGPIVFLGSLIYFTLRAAAARRRF